MFSLHALPVLDVNKTVLQQDGDGEEKIEKGQKARNESLLCADFNFSARC